MHEKRKYEAFHQESSIDIDSIIKDVLKQWWVIIIATIAAALLMGTYERVTYVPVYEVSTTFAVGKSGFSNNLAYDNLESAESVTTKFSQIANSSVLKKRVCEELGLDSFNARIQISIVESSNLMTLTVADTSPVQAYRIIHSVMDITMELGSELMDTVAVKELKPPVIPQAPANPLNISGTMKKAAVVMAALMVILFALISYFKDTVKNTDEAKKKLDARLLGTIHHEKKRKSKMKGLSIENPLVSFSYVESVRMTATRVRSAMDRRNAKILLVTSVSENEGKSTVAANLALALTQEEKKVALFDCDFRKPSQYKLFNIEKTQDGDFVEYLKGNQKIHVRNVGNLEKIGLFCSMSSSQRILKQDVIERLRRTLDEIQKQADYVIIDTSPMALVSDGEAIAQLADVSLLVVQQDMMETKYINDAIDQLNRTKAKVIGCVFNNVYGGFMAKTREYGYYGSKYKYQSRYGKKDKR